MNPLPQRAIGTWSVSAIGLGCMPLSFPEMIPHREQAIATIHRALDLGITLLDTSNIYAPTWDCVGHNESLVADALSLYTGPADVSAVLVTTKGGITRSEGEQWGRDSRESALKSACEASMTALGVSVIDLYQHHRHDQLGGRYLPDCGERRGSHELQLRLLKWHADGDGSDPNHHLQLYSCEISG